MCHVTLGHVAKYRTRHMFDLTRNNFPYSTCISSFFGSSIPTSLFIFKMFFRSIYVYSVCFTPTKLVTGMLPYKD